MEIIEYPPEWWGYKNGFVIGGFLGAKSKKRKAAADEASMSNKKIGFLEEDQENLYNLCQVSNDLLIVWHMIPLYP